MQKPDSHSFFAFPVIVAAILTWLVAGVSAHAAQQVSRTALTSNELRVCADPSNLPFSNKAGEGLENRIIEIIANELGKPIKYVWFPQTIGFVRNTLRLHECDLISGISTSSQLVQNTNPYYRSLYSLVYRADSGITATSLSDPVFKNKTIGVVAGTPPATLLAQYGLLAKTKPYQLIVDTRHFSPARQAIQDVAEGTIDAAVIWGPIAGYFAKRQQSPLLLIPLINETENIRLDFRVSMAVRYGETEWKHKINNALDQHQDEILEILHQYDIPLLDDLGNLIPHPVK